MKNPSRPLSPHISIYRWPITMVLSILHRATGIAMSVGLLVLVGWVFDAAIGAETYDLFVRRMSSLPGTVLLVGWSFAFFFHFSNGIRHLFWDIGKGFEKSQANASAWIVLLAATLATIVFWVLL